MWNRSGKISDSDFSLLINTFDYETIQTEVIKKLRKASMSFVKVYKNERECLIMLSKNCFSTNSTLKRLNNYVISHFWLKKLEFFRDLTMFERHESSEYPNKLMIGVHDYYDLKHIHISKTLMSYINDFCFEGKDNIYKIRFFICTFKFPLRMLYKEFLE